MKHLTRQAGCILLRLSCMVLHTGLGFSVPKPYILHPTPYTLNPKPYITAKHMPGLASLTECESHLGGSCAKSQVGSLNSGPCLGPIGFRV